jgi:hypothetical protein
VGIDQGLGSGRDARARGPVRLGDNSGGDQANNIAKTRNRGISGERGDPYRDQGGM